MIIKAKITAIEHFCFCCSFYVKFCEIVFLKDVWYNIQNGYIKNICGGIYMSTIENVNSEKVFKYFDEICAVPHGSGDMDRIAIYMLDADGQEVFINKFGQLY